jgi:carbamoyl-phosphate synthase small subunit
MQAFLALEDGRIFRGESYGAKRECFGEVVFNTALTGYQEIFTDPSYAGQIVVLTNPQIGNYGTNAADNEASRPYIEGLVTREFSPISSNWRSQQVTEEYLERFNVPVITAPCAALFHRSKRIRRSWSSRRVASAKWMAPTWRRS